MSYRNFQLAIIMGIFSMLVSCAKYQAQPLTEKKLHRQLQTPSIEQLTVQAKEIKHPLLQSIKLAMSPLSVEFRKLLLF